MKNLRLVLLGCFAVLGFLLVGTSLTGAVVGETTVGTDDVSHVGMLLLLATGLLFVLENYTQRKNEESEKEKIRVA